MRSVVLLTVDSLRYDHATSDLMPTLASLADAGVSFERAYAPGPRTPSSVPVCWTGEHMPAHLHGVYDGWPEKRERWHERRARVRKHLARHGTVAERFAAMGYDTACVTANPWTAADTGFAAGFDRFRDTHDLGRSGLIADLASRAGVEADWLLRWPDWYGEVEAALDALSEPYFLWLFVMDPHQPYLAPRRHRAENTAPEMYYANLRYNRSYGYTDDLPRHLDERLRRAYRDAVRSTDALLNRLLGDIGVAPGTNDPPGGTDPATGGADSGPAVAVHADHGEAFDEHGAYGHRLQLYEENVRVPLVVGNLGRAANVTAPTPLRRLPAMLRDAARDAVDPQQYTATAVPSTTEEGERTAVRTPRWTFVRGGDDWSYAVGGGAELYDRSVDPGERERVGAPDVQAVLARYLDGFEEGLAEAGRVATAVRALDGV